MLFKALKFVGKWVAIVAVCLIVIALVDSRKTATDAYNTATDIGGWGMGTSASGIDNFVMSGIEAFKANREPSDTEKALEKAKKAAEDK